MKLSGHTTPFAVLGHPIGHTLSPVMHNAALAAMDMDAIYLAFDVPPDRLLEVLPAMAAMGFQGVNLTIPLKEVAFNGLSDLDNSAVHLGAVNTVAFTSDGLKGYNTDGHGFLAAVREAFDDSVADKTVLVVGTGGAGRAVSITMAHEGVGRLILTDIDRERTDRLQQELLARTPDVAVDTLDGSVDAAVDACPDADLVVQATPVGMKVGDPSLLPPAAFRTGQKVIDMIYMYPETPFMKAASEAGAETANGLGMLLHQGARALEIWTGKTIPVDVMRRALETAVYST
jgi:shikimate dehydrogenase